MRWETRVTRLLDIRYPIIEGAMGFIGTAKLATAVSEAGALGMITASATRTPERFREQIRQTRASTNNPFAVNFSPAMTDELQEMFEVAIEEKVPVIETAGFPAKDYGNRVKQAGLIWLHKVTTVKHALAAERDGADAVTISALEAAAIKHPSTLTTLVSIPMAVKRMKVPVIAAGGIGDPHTFLAALALGAEAVLMGTVFCAVKECPLSDQRKQAFVDADPYDPVWRDPIYNLPKLEDLRNLRVKSKTSSTADLIKAERTAIAGGMDNEPSDVKTFGSSAVGFIETVPTAKELIDGIIQGAEEILTSTGIAGFKLTSNQST